MPRFFRKRPVDELIEKQRAELKSEPDILRSAALTGLAAFGGAVMNWNYVMAGTASLNGLLLAIELLLMLAWKNAGWIGLDRFSLTYLGTPWSPGRWFRHESVSPPPP